MPDLPPRRRKLIVLLSMAHASGQLVRVTCRCRPDDRSYEPADLIDIFGDVDVNRLDEAMKCERCNRGDNINVDVRLPSAAERARLRVCKLREIKIFKRPVWSAEP